MRSGKFGFPTLLLTAALILSAVVQPLSAEDVKNHDTLKIISLIEPADLDPATNYDDVGGWILQNTYETGWFYDTEKPDHWTPALAIGLPIVSTDGLTITFTLKPDIFSASYEPELPSADAQGFKVWGPLTAEDAKYSMDRTVIVGDQGGSSWMYEHVRGASDYIWGDKYGTQEGMNEYLSAGGITADGPMTVSFHLLEPVFDSYQVHVMMQPWYAIYSKDCVEAHGGLQPGQHSEWFSTHTCGTGPYVVTEWTSEQRLVMKANPYWRHYVATSYPKLTTIIEEFTIDSMARVDRLKRGEVDFADVPTSLIAEFVDNSARPPVANYSGIVVYPSPSLSLSHLTMQMDPAKRSNSPFLDQHVRQAFQYLVDKQGIIATLFGGLAAPAETPIMDGAICYQEARPDTSYTFNKTKACQVLLEAGYNSGNPIKVVYGYSISSRAPVIPEYLKAAAESADMVDAEGEQFIFIELRGEPWPSYLTNIRTGTAYDTYAVGWMADFPDPDNTVYPYLHGDGYLAERIGFNDSQINEWIGEAKTVSPRALACSLYKQIQERAAQLSPHIYIYQPIRLFLQRDWIQGFYPYSTNTMQRGYGFVWTMYKQHPATTITTTTTVTTTTTTPLPASSLASAVFTVTLVTLFRKHKKGWTPAVS